MNRIFQDSRRCGPLVIAMLTLLLIVLHQDYWFWSDRTLVFGVLPIGLFWHLLVSLAATAIWYLATRIAWPLDRPNLEPVVRSNGDELDSVSKEGRS